MKKAVLITGAAGFIGSHLAGKLLDLGYQVTGLDNFDDYYSPAIKRDNSCILEMRDGFKMVKGDIRDTSLLTRVFSENNISLVVHLAARAGVRPSLEKPLLYQDVNIGGTINLLEASRAHGVTRFVFASSSSVYGLNSKVPFSEEDKIESPTSPYGASKIAGELYCRTYHNLYSLPIVALRFFTVYGPRQRPEMAIHLFTRMIDSGEEIKLFGDGSSKRDYTNIEDIVSGIVRALTFPHQGFEIFNLGNSHPIALDYLIHLIEEALVKKARIRRLPVQAGDVPITYADVSKAKARLGYQPKIAIEEGIASFVQWYLKSTQAVRYAMKD
jgi:UDP-glucuronate 4-epimerase